MVEVILGTREDKPKKEIGARERNSRQLFYPLTEPVCLIDAV